MGVVLVYNVNENLKKLPLKVYNVHFSHSLTVLAGIWLRVSLTEISAEIQKAVAHWSLLVMKLYTLLYYFTYLCCSVTNYDILC